MYQFLPIIAEVKLNLKLVPSVSLVVAKSCNITVQKDIFAEIVFECFDFYLKPCQY